MKTGIELIKDERERQVSAEDWTPEHDDEHTDGALAMAASSYALNAAGVGTSYGERNPNWKPECGFPEIMRTRNGCLSWWPWSMKSWKPKDQLRDLVRAGALIAAEIDRLQRAANPNLSGGTSAPE